MPVLGEVLLRVRGLPATRTRPGSNVSKCAVYGRTAPPARPPRPRDGQPPATSAPATPRARSCPSDDAAELATTTAVGKSQRVDRANQPHRDSPDQRRQQPRLQSAAAARTRRHVRHHERDTSPKNGTSIRCGWRSPNSSDQNGNSVMSNVPKCTRLLRHQSKGGSDAPANRQPRQPAKDAHDARR